MESPKPLIYDLTGQDNAYLKRETIKLFCFLNFLKFKGHFKFVKKFSN